MQESLKYIKEEIGSIKQTAEKFRSTLTDDQAFNVMMLQYYCFKENNLEEIWYDVNKCLTDGSNDGGLDYVYFDEEENKIIIGQNKYSENISNQDCISEINKIISTIDDFDDGHTGKYNKKVKEVFQDAVDRLTDEFEGNIEVVFSSLNIFKTDNILNDIKESDNISQIVFHSADDIKNLTEKIKSRLEVISEDSLKIDIANNCLTYENDEKSGLFVNISSKSLTSLFNKYENKGLFNLNIRRYIRNRTVDDGINYSLNNKRQDFWFLNNGLTIACNEYSVDGNKVKLYDFSIVNGGQTTTLIGKYKGKNKDEFFIPCKIVAPNEKITPEELMKFFNDIAEATNSQKPIQPKDLKSNAPEMMNLKKLLEKNKIGLEIKRGEKHKASSEIKIKNDVFAQLIHSFVNQKPGTARSNKKSLFSNNKAYRQIFMKNYKDDENKREFIIDLIKLNERFETLSKEYKKNGNSGFTSEEANVFVNAKFILFALFGVIYRLINNDINLDELRDDTSLAEHTEFNYGSFISNYKNDDIDEKLDEMIKYLVESLTTAYSREYDAGKVTSVSNFFKTDKKYMDDIIKSLVSPLNRPRKLNEFMSYGTIFKRKQ